jgi:hypothetical protein
MNAEHISRNLSAVAQFNPPTLHAMTLKEIRLPALLLSALFAAAAALPAKEDDVKETFSKTYALAATGSLVLSNLNGDISVVAWDRNEVALEAEKFARDEENLRRIEIVVDARPDKLTIRTRHHKGDDGPARRREARGGVRYQLKVPATLANLKLNGMNSNLSVEGIRGNVDLNTMNGRIDAASLSGNANLDTMNGPITASFDRVGGSQRISLDSMNGSCTVHLPDNASARIDASTMNGHTQSDLPITIERSSRRSLRGSIGTGEARIELDSMNGSLHIKK